MAFTLVLLLQLLLVSLASASHQQGGHKGFSFKGRNPDGTFRVKFRSRETYDHCRYNTWNCYTGNCGSRTINQQGVIERRNYASAQDWCETERVITRNVPSDKPFQLRQIGCCWVRTRNGLSDTRQLTSVDLGSRSDTGKPNNSPDIGILPFLRVPQNCPRTYKLMSSDPDGDNVRCRYGNIRNIECGTCDQPSGFDLDQGSCSLHYRSASANSNIYGFEMVVEDFPRNPITLAYSDGSRAAKIPLAVSRKKRSFNHATTPWGWHYTSPPTTASPRYPTTRWWHYTTPPTTTTSRPTTPWWSWHTTTTQRPTTPWWSWHTTTTQRPTTPWRWWHSTTPWWWHPTTTPRPTAPWHWHPTTTPRPTTPWWWHPTTTPRPTTPWWWHPTTTPRPTTPWRWWHSTTPWWWHPTTTPRPTTPWRWWHSTTPWWWHPTTTPRSTAPWHWHPTTTPRPTTPWHWHPTTTPRPTTPWWWHPTTTPTHTHNHPWWWWHSTTPWWTTTPRTPTTSPEHPLSQQTLQFSFLVDPSAPSCQEGLYLPKLVHPTPNNGARFQVEANKEVELRVKALVTYGIINNVVISGPLNISKHRNTHGEFVIRWTPTPDDVGEHFPICFAVESVTGSRVYQSEMRCVLVEVHRELVKANVICDESTMTVEVEKASFPRLHEDHLRLNDPVNTACSLQTNSNSTHIIAVVPLSACGTQIEEDDDDLTFKNEITTLDNIGDLITRRDMVEVQFFCKYPKRGNVTQSFSVHRKNVTVCETGFGTFTYQFEFYPTNQYRTMADPNSYPLEYDVGSEIHMQIEATSTVNNTELFVESCRAAPYDNPNYQPTYSIIENGCNVDPTVVVHPSSHDREFRFSMEAFKFIGMYDQVYISCSVMMCEAGVPNTRCSQGCINSVSVPGNLIPSRRKRQAVTQSLRHLVSQGPLRFRRSAESTGNPGINLNLNLVFIAGCLLAAVGMISAVVMYKAKMSRVRYQPLPRYDS
ncbi:hypothetical protein ABVT39_028201 [Epinephelus coioides]